MDEHNYTVFPIEETKKERRQRIKDSVAWYIKWCASLLLVLAMTMRATGDPYYSVYDLWFSFIGVIGWLIVSILWKDRALILLNSVGGMILLTGILKSLV